MTFNHYASLQQVTFSGTTAGRSIDEGANWTFNVLSATPKARVLAVGYSGGKSYFGPVGVPQGGSQSTFYYSADAITYTPVTLSNFSANFNAVCPPN